jgi:hypothetical protein
MFQTLSISLLITLVVELLFSLAVRLRNRHDLLLICAVNCLTNPAAVFIHYRILYRTNWNLTITTILLETAVIIAEALLLWRFARAINNPILFSASANILSFSIGKLINAFF